MSTRRILTGAVAAILTAAGCACGKSPTTAAQTMSPPSTRIELGPCGWPIARSVTKFEGEEDPGMGDTVRQVRLAYEQWTAQRIRDYQLVVACDRQGGYRVARESTPDTYHVTVRNGHATDGWTANGAKKRTMTQREADFYTVDALLDVSRSIIARCFDDGDCRAQLVRFKQTVTPVFDPFGPGLGPFFLRDGRARVIVGLNGDGLFPFAFGFKQFGGLDEPNDVLLIREFHVLKP